MKTLNDRTYILLGACIPGGYEVIGGMDDVLKNENVVLFKFNDALDLFLNEDTPVSGVFKQLMKNGSKLPPNFISIIIEDFLYMNRDFGPIVFVDFPKTIEQMVKLDTALAFYRGGDVIVNSYINLKPSCEDEEIEKILSFCRTNNKYKISDFNTLPIDANVLNEDEAALV